MENSSVYTQLEVLWYHTLPFEDSLDRSYYIWTLERNLQTCENRTHGTDSSQIYGNIYSYTDGLPASTKYVQTHVFFKGFEWWIAEGYSGAAWEASVLQWSRAETFGCCVWGSKPAAWIVCNRERRWNVFCLDSTKMYFSVQSVHHTSYIIPQHITHDSVCDPRGCYRIMLHLSSRHRYLLQKWILYDS